MTLSLGRPKALDSLHFLVPCQINVVNKQLVSHFTWNKLGEAYILTIGSHVDTKKRHSLGAERVYDM